MPSQTAVSAEITSTSRGILCGPIFRIPECGKDVSATLSPSAGLALPCSCPGDCMELSTGPPQRVTAHWPPSSAEPVQFCKHKIIGSSQEVNALFTSSSQLPKIKYTLCGIANYKNAF